MTPRIRRPTQVKAPPSNRIAALLLGCWFLLGPAACSTPAVQNTIPSPTSAGLQAGARREQALKQYGELLATFRRIESGYKNGLSHAEHKALFLAAKTQLAKIAMEDHIEKKNDKLTSLSGLENLYELAMGACNWVHTVEYGWSSRNNGPVSDVSYFVGRFSSAYESALHDDAPAQGLTP